jgi:type IV secretion system protein VirB5
MATAVQKITLSLSRDIPLNTEADKLRRNPLGIYVNAINWSKELGQ